MPQALWFEYDDVFFAQQGPRVMAAVLGERGLGPAAPAHGRGCAGNVQRAAAVLAEYEAAGCDV